MIRFKNLYRNLHKNQNNYNNSSPEESKTKTSIFLGASPKLTFLVGVLIGISLLSTAGFFILLGYTLKNRGTSDKTKVAGVQVNSNLNVNSQPQAQAPTVDTSKLSPVSNQDHKKGDENAKVTLIEYSDFQCPYCSRHHPNMKALFDKYAGKVAWVYRHFPLTSIHPQALPAAEASECASEQGKFWEYSDKLFENQSSLATDYFPRLASELGLDTKKFQECLDSDKYLGLIQKQSAEAQSAGARGTPATFVGDQMISGAVPLAQMESIIDNLLSTK